MWEYVSKVQRALIEQHGIAENPDKPGVPVEVADGVYPVEIDGRTDYVEIAHGTIHCCRWSP